MRGQFNYVGHHGGEQQAPRASPNMFNLVAAAPSVVAPNISVIRGTLLVFSSRASVLVDIGASCSFISLSCASSLDLEMSRLTPTLLVDTPIGGLVLLDQVCHGCELVIADRNIVIDLIVIDMLSFDVILGMD